MKRFTLTAAAGSTLLVASLCSAPAAIGAPPAHASALRTAHICAVAAKGYAHCDAQVVVDSVGKPAVASAPKGLGPADIRSAYALSASAGAGRTVAIIDAYNDPTAESDLAAYRKNYGLVACTSASGCFRKVSQTGGATLPKTDAGWATEISLDLDMVSAACPACKILLVEATSSSFANLGVAVNYAATQHVVAISNSYGGADSGPNSAYNHPGIAITASTGDNGYGIESPASYGTVVAVGGTSLTKASTSRGWTEKAWSGAGSGCSKLNAKPSWQGAVTLCSGKAAADVSAVADPQTGVAVYDSTAFNGVAGWQIYGGTSASAPIIAGVYAMSGNTAGYPASYTWAHTAGLNDVTTGTNGTCPTSVWCTARAGWDGPTGLGTPKGTSSF
ncbi:MAG: peptidase S8 [Pseudonocardiales bacterium]|nr:MAG: peptidase S8 [Pseudonocardiales bacterium]